MNPSIDAVAMPHRRLAIIIAASLLGAYTLRIAVGWQRWHLPDFLNLPIHETGHLVFAWGSEPLVALGGTLLQLGMPLIFAGYFVRRNDPVGTGCMVWWCGQSGINVARYVADARAQALPLVGGGEHDWTYLLSHWGVLARDIEIARAIRLVAVAIMAIGIWLMVRRSRPVEGLAVAATPADSSDVTIREVGP